MKTKENSQATTGSSAKIKAARVAVVICCAHAITVNARAVETGVVVPGVTTSELTTAGLGVAVVQLEVAASRL